MQERKLPNGLYSGPPKFTKLTTLPITCVRIGVIVVIDIDHTLVQVLNFLGIRVLR